MCIYNIMWIKTIILCSLLAFSTAADEKKKDDTRGKRNLEYTISHTYPSYRLERRISNVFPARYSQFFPGQPRPSYSFYMKNRQNSVLPPYAVQMEPLAHYSQRDPLYDPTSLQLIQPNNELSKPDDLLTDNNHLNENVYGPPKHYIERPVYIKEPEPIIEIIIKEANTTAAPPVVLTPAPKKKKEEVQVFYVKYKKNPHGMGKDSVIYDKPIPAISPIQDEHIEEENYGAIENPVTYAPPATTTIRAIIKPESETYHADTGIHITFGGEKHNTNAEKYSHDDDTVESAPQPAVSHPEARRFPEFKSSLQSTQEYKQEQRLPQPYRPFNFQENLNTRFSQYQNFQRPASQPQLPQFPAQNFHNVPTRPAPPQFQSNFQTKPFNTFDQRPAPSFDSRPHHQQFERPQNNFEHRPQQNFERPFEQHHRPNFENTNFESRPPQSFNRPQFNERPFFDSRPPVSFENRPFEKKPSQSFERPPQFQFPRPQTHFPIHQQLPLNQNPQNFNQAPQRPAFSQQINHNQQQNIQYQQIQRPLVGNQQQQQQQQPQTQRPITQKPFNTFQQFPQQNQEDFRQQQQFNLNTLQQNQHIIPPGGELISSIPKYEQHISIPSQNQDHLSQEQLTQQIQQQFGRNIPREQPEVNNYAPIPQIDQNNYQNINFQINNPTPKQPFYQTTPKPITTKKYFSTTQPTTTTTSTPTTTTVKTESTTTDLKALNLELPDEVPDDLREQLLSSGILKNAQISVLDYDKVGDIPLSALPPDQLANFYSAGGAQQIQAAGSEIKPTIVKPDGIDQEVAGSENEEVKVKPPVEMKVVHYDPQTQQGQQVHDSYVKEGATQVEPVVLNDQTYNRYLPLKVSGAQFPIPDVPELKGKNINSVVVLAPIDYNFNKKRVTRSPNQVNDEIKYVRNDVLKDLLEDPSMENYKKFLERENTTTSDKQSVILLVTGSTKDREIFMYDVATQSVSKLDGELSSAFVDAAESNTKKGKKSPEEPAAAASNLIETKVPLPEGTNIDRRHYIDEIELDGSASELINSKIPIIDPMQTDLEAEGSEQLETFVDVSGLSLRPHEDLTLAASENHVSISSGYSKTEYALPSN